jgi:hypothetical protein
MVHNPATTQLAVRGEIDMRHRAIIVCGLALLVASLRFTTPTWRTMAYADTPVPAAQSLNFDVQFRDTVLAATSAEFTLGDRFILNDRLLKDGKEVGHNGGVCTIIDTAGEAMCTVIFALPEGAIATEFLNTPPPEKVFAIVGGTGRYQGARGSGELVEASDQTGTLAFHLIE